MEEVSRAQDDMHNLLAATDIASLFLDQELAIKLYTPRVTELFHFMPSDRGRPIGHLKPGSATPPWRPMSDGCCKARIS